MEKLKKRYFRTAEFARMAHLNKKTLHYYDELGLFKPAFVNEKGYRFYALYQLDRLALIAALKDLGVPLKEIREYLECGDPDRLDRMLDEQDREIERHMERLKHSRELLRGLRAENRIFRDCCGKGCQVLEWPQERIARLTDMSWLMDSPGDGGPREGMVVNYLTDGPHTGLCIQGKEQFLYQKRKDGEQLVPGGRYLCLYGEEEGGTAREARLQNLERLRQYAAEHRLRLEERIYIDFSDVLIAQPDRQYFCIRVRLLEGEEYGKNDKKESSIL